MAKAPRILFINRVYPPHRGATGRMLRDLARACRKQGWRVDVLATGKTRSTYKDTGVKVHLIRAKQTPSTAIDYAFIWRKLKNAAIKMERPDVVITLTDPPFFAIAGTQVAEHFGVPHIHWSHDVYPDLLPVLGTQLPSLVYKMLRRMMIRSLKNAHSVVTIGDDMMRHLRSSGLQTAQFVTIPNWADPELPKPSGKNKFNIKSLQSSVLKNTKEKSKPFENLIKSDLKFRVLYAGNTGKAHPIQPILKAAVILNKTHPDIEFTFVGDGPKFNRIAKWRADKQLDNIRLLPYQPKENLREILESGDIHLVSMKSDARALLVPCKFYAALCVSRPCVLIGPDDCEIANVINEHGCGTVVTDDNGKNLARAIAKYRDDGAHWSKAYDGAVQARKAFTHKKSLSLWIKTIRGIDPQRFKVRKPKKRQKAKGA
jgi:colanic acid biosynthesis glycosyl transferase WcaI